MSFSVFLFKPVVKASSPHAARVRNLPHGTRDVCVSARIVGSRSQGRICGYLRSRITTQVSTTGLREYRTTSRKCGAVCHFFCSAHIAWRVYIVPFSTTLAWLLWLGDRRWDYIKVQVSLMRDRNAHCRWISLLILRAWPTTRSLIKHVRVPIVYRSCAAEIAELAFSLSDFDNILRHFSWESCAPNNTPSSAAATCVIAVT